MEPLATSSTSLMPRVLDLSPAYFSYTASKSALWTLTRTLAQSLAPRIRVNALSPGPAVPPPGVSKDAHEKRLAELPLQHAADAEGLADGLMAILSLPSFTGQMLALRWRRASRMARPPRTDHTQKMTDDTAPLSGADIIRNFVKTLPASPGVYRMYDGEGEVVVCRQGPQPEGAR